MTHDRRIGHGSAVARGATCVVTDCRRLAAAAGGGDPAETLARFVEDAASAGVDLVHLREPDLAARELRDLAARLKLAIGSRPTRLVIGDRVDVAHVVGTGVHLKAASMPARRVRDSLPSGSLIGRSAHDEAEIDLAGQDECDYIILGTLFPTGSKGVPHPSLGVAGAARLVARTTRPVLLIGGIDRSRMAEAAATGGHGIAAIGLFIDAWLSDGAGGPAGLEAIVGEVRARFDR